MDINQASYDKIAAKWAETRKDSSVSKLVLALASKLQSGTILDVGCGTGFPVIAYLSKKGFYSTGLDFSKQMITIAQSFTYCNTTLLHSDFFDFETKEKYDAIIAWDSFFHFPKEKQALVYPKAASLLNPGGYLLFTHGSIEDEHTDTMMAETFYYSCLSKEATIQNLISNGFIIEYAHENYTEGTHHRDLVVLARKK